ncbi:MAG: DUF1684 domain-containing protein [Nitriliruptorales bacterium]
MTLGGREPDETLSLLDYRRRVAEAYRLVREAGGGEDAWREWRTTRDELLGSHPQSAVGETEQPGFRGISYFAYGPAWAVDGQVVPAAEEERMQIGHSGDGGTWARGVGLVRFTVDGDAHELSLYWLDQYGGGLFLPFRDATAGRETYGGGRYLLDTAKGADLGGGDRTLHLDFNFAYHPSCVWSPRWSCPLAPPENRLDVAIRAGERLS